MAVGVIVVAFVVTAGAWLRALFVAQPKQTPLVFVMGDLRAPAPRAVRVVALPAGGGGPAPFRGHVGGAPVRHGVAAVSAPLPWVLEGEVAGNGVRLVLVLQEGDVEGGPSPASSSTLPQPGYSLRSWRQGLARVPQPAGDLPAAYPIDGLASSTLPSQVILDEGSRLVEVTVQPRVTGPRLNDGRVLEPDRSGISVELLDLLPAPGTTLRARVRAIGPVYLDFLLDGVVLGVRNLEAQGSAEVALTLPSDAPRGGLVVVHAATQPWAEARGRTAVAFVGGEVPAQVAQAEPGLAAHVDGVLGRRALLSRVVPDRVRAPSLSPSPQVQQTEHRRAAHDAAEAARTFWRFCAVVLLVLSMVAGGASASRGVAVGPAVLAVLACCALLGGLDAVLGFAVGAVSASS